MLLRLRIRTFAGLVLAAALQIACDPGTASARVQPSTLERALIDVGLENVTVLPSAGIGISFENRRYRHSAEAFGHARAATNLPLLMGERRLGLLVAAVHLPDSGTGARFRALYPSDAGFPELSAAPMHSTTFTRADFDIGALVDYRVGQIDDPFHVRTQLEPRLILNPWPGARVRFGVAIPLQNDFPVSEVAPDLDRVRPSRASLDQFGWVSGLALCSLSGGYFGDNRWGVSVGAARPLAGGAWLLDSQVDRTGFLAFTAEDVLYSMPDRTSAFAGLTWRPPTLDLALRLRGGQFLYGDRGAELEVRRTFSDVDVAYFVQRTDGLSRYGVRLDIPVPPMTRSTGSAVRIQPVARFALDFRETDDVFGRTVDGVASREEMLRQLSAPALDANRDRYDAALHQTAVARRRGPQEWVSFTGMSGFIHTPWAGVLSDRDVEMGFGFIPREWAYDHRGTNDNQVFYATLGFLPRVETALRWTRIPGVRVFEELAPESRLVDMDRMASARVALLEPAPGRPGLSVGVEDARGTGRFHSTYAVAGLPFSFLGSEFRLTAGYGFRVQEVHRRVLDGTFGAAEVAPWAWLRAQVEYDTEKWNAGVGLSPIAGLRLRAALLHLESLSVGVGWSHGL